MTPRLRVDESRCADGLACPFATTCKRQLTLMYDTLGDARYSSNAYYADIGTDPEGKPWCVAYIPWKPRT